MSASKEKIAFFDFCDTLVPFQSADSYVKYVLKHHKSLPMLMRRIFIVLLRDLHLLNWLVNRIHTTHKALNLWQLKGISEAVLNEMANCFYRDMIVPKLIPQTYSRLKELQAEGYRIVLVSGGYGIYLRLFAKDNGIKQEDMLATELIFKDGVFTGKMGEDCMNETKVIRLERAFNRNKIYAVAFSDSITDLPLLSWCDEAYLVLHTLCHNRQEKKAKLNILYV